MSFIGFNGGAGSGLRFTQTRGRIQGAQVSGVNYPSPFFDVAHTYLPVTVKQLFRWCRYYFLTNPLINATVFKLSEYPVTDIIVDHDSPEVKKRWTEYFHDQLRIRAFQVEGGLDYNCYGNGMFSIGYPFKKYLYCRSCDFRDDASKIRAHWSFTNYNFRLTCPRCHQIGDAQAQDYFYKNPSGIKVIRWNPEDVEITYNDITGDYTYYYTIPPVVRNDIIIGRKDIVEAIPQVFIQAMREMKGVVFNKDNFFHMRRPTLATQDRGWGIPLLLPVLKDTFYLQVMKKAQEAILLEHIVPLRILFPQAGSGSSDPYTTINLVDWREQIANEIARWRYDNNYIPILPLPVGNQTIGGDGRALMLTSEIQAWSEQIMVGMGVPKEFLLGGMSYAGTNVSMRMLENAFIGYILRQRQLTRWIMRQVAAFLEWPEANIRFKAFKMADDLQRRALDLQLNQAGKLSDTTLLAGMDYNVDDENELMMREADRRIQAQKKQQLALAEVQGESQLIMMKYQVKGQQVMADAQAMGPAPGEPGGDPNGAGALPPGGDPAAAGAGGAPPVQMDPGAQPPGTPDGASAGPAAFLQGIGSQLSGSARMGKSNLNVDLPSFAMAQAQQIASLPKAQQEMALANLDLQSPELGAMVRQMLGSISGGTAGGGASGGGGGTPAPAGVDTRPLPEQRGPRRTGASV